MTMMVRFCIFTRSTLTHTIRSTHILAMAMITTLYWSYAVSSRSLEVNFIYAWQVRSAVWLYIRRLVHNFRLSSHVRPHASSIRRVVVRKEERETCSRFFAFNMERDFGERLSLLRLITVYVWIGIRLGLFMALFWTPGPGRKSDEHSPWVRSRWTKCDRGAAGNRTDWARPLFGAAPN